MLTKAEHDVHMTLHADYRDWCPDCVAGRGISHQHRSSKKERPGREFSVDYAFMTAEDVGEDMCPVLVGYDNDSHGIWALAVDAKGATKSSVQWVNGKIDEAGPLRNTHSIAIRSRRSNYGTETTRCCLQEGRNCHVGVAGQRLEGQWCS